MLRVLFVAQSCFLTNAHAKSAYKENDKYVYCTCASCEFLKNYWPDMQDK